VPLKIRTPSLALACAVVSGSATVAMLVAPIPAVWQLKLEVLFGLTTVMCSVAVSASWAVHFLQLPIEDIAERTEENQTGLARVDQLTSALLARRQAEAGGFDETPFPVELEVDGHRVVSGVGEGVVIDLETVRRHMKQVHSGAAL
jgi:hypothetical protein